MIQYGKNKYKNDLKALWKRCFPQDTDRFVALYFDEIYKNDESLLYLDDHCPLAFLQMIPYSIQTGRGIYSAAYLSGIMTHPEYRGKGYMTQLLTASFDEMVKKGYDYTFLIPQQRGLAGMYANYGFRLCEPSSQPPVNQVLKTPGQWAVIRQDFFDENGVWLEKEPAFPNEQKGMIKRLNPEAEEITALYMGMMLD
ncbi:MAG: GNAT family N-acetyltransferase [Dysgonamonadaceae bacterium]|jgi:GNAT superfamily N-acetyltransferase|nr:GNAT family N-acetyltransferase [Dysgonamonadaceae bacterium]